MNLHDRLVTWRVPLLDLKNDGLKHDHFHAGISSVLGHEAREWSIGAISQREGMVELELATASPHIEQQLMATGRELTQIRFGRQQCVMYPPAPIAACSWEELQHKATASRQDHWAVRYVTPTSFRKDRIHSTPWPDPYTVMRSGASRWKTVAPPELHSLWPDEDCARALLVTDVKSLDSTCVVLAAHEPDKKKLSAVTGLVRYRCVDKALCGRWDMAWRFMEFMGIGTATAWGLGKIELQKQRQVS